MSASRLLGLFPSREWCARLVAAALLAGASPVRAVPPPPQWMKLVQGARVLPGAQAVARERLESTPAWRDGLVRYDLRRRAEIRPARSDRGERDFGADLFERPAPMAWSDGSPVKPESADSSELLVGRAAASEAARSGSGREPGPGTASRPPGPGGAARRAEPHPGAGPTRATGVEAEGPPGAYRLLARYVVDGADFYFTGEAAALHPGELLTAGHCVYNHDPNGDGDSSDARWASEVWVWPAGSEQVSAAGPAGWLPAAELAVHESWIARAAADYNAAIITAPSMVRKPEGPDREPNQ